MAGHITIIGPCNCLLLRSNFGRTNLEETVSAVTSNQSFACHLVWKSMVDEDEDAYLYEVEVQMIRNKYMRINKDLT